MKLDHKDMGLSRWLHQLLLVIMISVLAVSCLENPSSGGNRRKTSSQGATSSDNSTDTPDAPTFSGSANFFQNGSSQNTTTTILPGDFATSLYLRGSQVDKFINDGEENTVQCLAIPFTNTAVKKVLVLAAYPRFFNNFSSGTREYFYEVQPSAANNNSTFCQQPGVLSNIISNYTGSSAVYQLGDVCPNCTLSTVLSDPVALMTEAGLAVTEVVTINLRLELRPEFSSNIPTNLTCTTSSECVSKGYDCCSFGQCVNDKQVRSDADQTSLGFQQALLDIQNNPGSITNYPEYFHLCALNIPVDDEATPRPDPAVEASERFLLRKALYDCTSPVEGEMAICQKTYTDVQDTITSSGSNQFYTGEDDRNFNTNYSGTSTLPTHSIFNVRYAGETLYENGAIVSGMTIGPSGNGTGNDNLDDPQVINLTATPSNSAPNDDLTIQYKIDGSCESVSTFIAKCYKVYIQGQNLGKVTDHFPASNNFLLPYYADTNKTITVSVDEAQSFQFSDWNLVQTTPARVEFAGSSLSVFDTQEVKITFFVNLQNYPNVLQAKKEAVDEIKTICGCGTLECRLKEVFDASGNVVDYKCFYPPPPLPPPPLQQTVLVSAKSAPHRFYDLDGVYHESAFDSETKQEGTEFSYTSNNLLTPNNVDNYIGFNEIYGSFTKKSATALPAKEIRVQSGKTYDIYTDSGTYSSCFFCGTDYYSSLARLFPQSFLSNGGGYSPDLSTNDPLSTRTYRKDDLLFGRACFVPATMIPWTHAAESTRQDQRRKRLAAQHFLFANGYQRDWYGFDYGSVIGSFDGVRWFSIGNQRRIQARSNKLFLAVNSYYSDLTDNTTFSVTVQDTSTVSGLGAFVTSDFESDGAECQKNHVCETDSDCASQLGWEYSCESITSITTPWPRFDANGLEIPGVSDIVNLRNLFGQTTGSTKRCVYRGRGAMCIQDYTTADVNSNFTGTAQAGLHGCSANTYCQPFIEGVAMPLFNDRIARFGKSVKAQNASDLVTEDDLDVIGLGARLLGRPFAWRGTATIPVDAQTNLGTNDVTAVCIAGRDNNDDTFISNHSTTPTSEALGDQISNIGVTPSITDGNSGSRADYVSRCSVFDDGGNYFHEQTAYANTNLSSSTVTNQAGRQAISTNLLSIFEAESLPVNEIIKKYEEEFIDEFVYQEDRCLRAPGSTCFSALDCAPNAFISGQIASINTDDTTVTALLNKYDVQFWKEELTCSQDKTPDDADFDLTENRCCRETNNNLTIGTATVDGDGSSNRDLDFLDLPGLTTSINSSTRNTRLSTVWDLLQGSPASYPPLRGVRADSCGSTCGSTSILSKQFNTFSEIATRTCCSKNWVRLFDSEDNGGGHTWSASKLQKIPKETFRCYNYSQCVDSTNPAIDQCGDETGDSFFGFTCNHTDEPDEPNCRARQITEPEAERIFDWMETFELTGIPQVTIKSDDDSSLHCEVDPFNQSLASANGPPGLFASGATREYDDGANERFSAADMTNFDQDNIKRIFSPDKVVCCLPAGTQVGADADPDQCCTGYIGSSGRCQLPSYADVSLYLNRYVSSEAQDEDIASFDSETGYLTSPFDVIRIACKNRICESNSLVEGVGLSNLRTRGHESSDKQKFRFIDGDDPANAANGLSELYDRGLKWNTHYYCNDLELENPLPGTIDCGSL